MKILFADDHQLILNGLISIIKEKFPNAEIHTASNKNQLFECLNDAENGFDVLIQDIKFGTDNANDFLGEIRKGFPKMKIMVLSSISDAVSINKIKKKIDGYVLKSDPLSEILEAIEEIHSGSVYFSKEVQKKLEAFKNVEEVVLTLREKEILTVLMQERSTKEIADVLCISQKTVEMHRANLFVKLDVKNLTGLVKKVIALDLLGE